MPGFYDRIVTRGNEMSIELSYQGKLPCHIAITSAPSCRLKELGTYGQAQLGGWSNRLVKDNNLVKGKSQSWED
jgi:hypothetical protein